jgi:DHA2 family multidrug resistance protein
MNTGLTHDWASADFVPSQCVEAVGLAFGITALVAFGVANITPPQAAAIAATIQIARLFGAELGFGGIQTLVRVREQVHSNLVGLHVQSGSVAVETATAQLAGRFGARPVGTGDAALQGAAILAGRIAREAQVLAYLDAFWLIAWVSVLGILFVALLRPPPANPITSPRLRPRPA